SPQAAALAYRGGEDVLVVRRSVEVLETAERGRVSRCPRVGAEEQVPGPGVRPDRIGPVGDRQPGVVAPEDPAELGRRRRGAGAGSPRVEAREVARGREAEVREAGGLVASVLPVVVRHRQPAVAEEVDPLPPLIGGPLSTIVGDQGEITGIGAGTCERL